MEKRPTSPKESQAPRDNGIIENGDLFPDSLPPLAEFQGTDNPRHLRVIDALEAGQLMREELDRIAGCSNGPQLVDDLRGLGLQIECEKVRRIDRDGRRCWPGRYFLTEIGRAQLQAWRQRGRQ